MFQRERRERERGSERITISLREISFRENYRKLVLWLDKHRLDLTLECIDAALLQSITAQPDVKPMSTVWTVAPTLLLSQDLNILHTRGKKNANSPPAAAFSHGLKTGKLSVCPVASLRRLDYRQLGLSGRAERCMWRLLFCRLSPCYCCPLFLHQPEGGRPITGCHLKGGQVSSGI